MCCSTDFYTQYVPVLPVAIVYPVTNVAEVPRYSYQNTKQTKRRSRYSVCIGENPKRCTSQVLGGRRVLCHYKYADVGSFATPDA